MTKKSKKRFLRVLTVFYVFTIAFKGIFLAIFTKCPKKKITAFAKKKELAVFH
jgi:hypothetical protein